MGVFQLKRGNWGYRVLVKDEDGVTRNRRAVTDQFGHKFTTKREATIAMNEVMDLYRDIASGKKRRSKKTVTEIFEEYCEVGRSNKAFGTIRKQDSVWKIHLKKDFGDRYVTEITAAEVNDYLNDLYYAQDYAYKYVEGFLKMFYLIFGQACSREYMTLERYNKLCVDKGTKIRMPKLKVDEDTDIKTFDREQLKLLDDYFKGTNIEAGYMLGRYCGLRMGECLGVTWDCVDFDKGVITIDKQLQVQDGLVRIVPVKTRNAKRQVMMCDKLKQFLYDLYIQREKDKVRYAAVREQKEKKLKMFNGNVVSSLDLVNTLGNGKMQTDTVLRFHARYIKARLHMDFKFHYLRHTYGTRMALLNIPQYLLCNQMGHGNINVTGKYYLGENKDSWVVLKECVDRL